MDYYVNFLGRLSSIQDKGLAPMAIEKNQNPGGRFGATI